MQLYYNMRLTPVTRAYSQVIFCTTYATKPSAGGSPARSVGPLEDCDHVGVASRQLLLRSPFWLSVGGYVMHCRWPRRQYLGDRSSSLQLTQQTGYGEKLPNKLQAKELKGRSSRWLLSPCMRIM